MRAILDALQPVVLAFAVIMMVYLFLFQPHKVDGSSMYPSFKNGDYILTEKLSYRNNNPKRGDIVVFHAPPPHTADYIKRVIGLPGETIMVQSGRVFINGQSLNEPYLSSSVVTSEKSFLREGISYTIPPDYFMMLGDNRSFSSDSREFGPVSKRAVVGRANVRYWPLSTLGTIQKPIYPAIAL
jgi:signal peptidase I